MRDIATPTVPTPYATSLIGDDPVLEKISVEGTVSGCVMYSITRQTYRNASDEEIEIVYTFPLSPSAVLTRLSVQINDKHLNGYVMPKKQASQNYEKALEDGNSPVMVENPRSGIYTANIANILPGETVTLELHVSQTLTQIGSEMRIRIPTVIAPNYGDATSEAGLAPHQAPVTDSLAEYPFAVQIKLHGQTAVARVSSPSHKIKTTTGDLAQVISLDQAAFIDRDFILQLSDLPQNQITSTLSNKDESYLAMVSVTPSIEVPTNDRGINLKVLLDCSGSMAGERIDQAKRALRKILNELTPQDKVSLTVFGTQFEHLIPSLTPCSIKTLSALNKLLKTVDADLGGTNMHEALEATYEIPTREAAEGPCDVLLITDGDTWNIDAITASAIVSGHRIFCLGVGSAPGESLLSDLADHTAGAFDLASSDENIATAISTLFARLRLGAPCQVSVNWGAKPIWQSSAPKLLLNGETFHLFAELENEPNGAPTIDISNKQGQETICGRAYSNDNSALSLVAMKKMREMLNAEERLQHALKYELISDATNLILIYERETKADGNPTLKQIDQMLPKGWGGSSGLEVSQQSFGITMKVSAAMSPSAARVFHSGRVNASSDVSSSGMEDVEIPAFLRTPGYDDLPPLKSRSADPSNPYTIEPLTLLTHLLKELSSGKFSDLEQLIDDGMERGRIWEEVYKKLGDRETAIAAFALALEMLLHAKLREENEHRLLTKYLNQARTAGNGANIEVVKHTYRELVKAFPFCTLDTWD